MGRAAYFRESSLFLGQLFGACEKSGRGRGPFAQTNAQQPPGDRASPAGMSKDKGEDRESEENAFLPRPRKREAPFGFVPPIKPNMLMAGVYPFPRRLRPRSSIPLSSVTKRGSRN